MNKQVLREVYLEKRKTLTPSEHHTRSLAVCNRAIDFLNEAKLSKVHLFLPIEKQKEADTWSLLKFMIEDPLYTPIVSVTDFSTKLMTHYKVNSDTEFVKDRFGIPNPISGDLIEVNEIDAVFTPLISFDKIGNRIGYGGGYYDRFLASCKQETLIIGLAITPPLDFIPYAEAHDFKMHFCINHLDILDFSA